MHFMSLGLKRTNKIHPEIVDVPGCIKYNRNFHLAEIDPSILTRGGLSSGLPKESGSFTAFQAINASKVKKSNPPGSGE